MDKNADVKLPFAPQALELRVDFEDEVDERMDQDGPVPLFQRFDNWGSD